MASFAVATIFRVIDRLSRPVNRMQRVVNRFTSLGIRNFKKLTRTVTSFSQKILAVGVALTTGALSYGLVDAAQKAISFDHSLTQLSAKLQGTAERGSKTFNELSAAAKKIGAETEFSTSQAAQGLNFLAMAGFDAQQSIASLPAVVDLATAAQVDLARATDIATNSLGAYNMKSKDSAQLQKNLSHINDVYAATVTSSGTTIELMFETLLEAGPVAQTAGLKIEKLAALIGKLADSGIKGEKGGTALKNIIVSLSAQTPKAAAELKKLGVATKTTSGDLRDVFEIFDDLNQAFQKQELGTAEITEKLNTIFGKIPLPAVNNLLKISSDELRKYQSYLENATGASKKMAAVMRDDLKGSIDSLLSAFEALQITLFALNNGAFKKFIDQQVENLRWINKLIESNDKLATSISGNLLQTLLAALKIIGLLIFAFLSWKIAVLAFNIALSAFSAGILTAKFLLLTFKGILTALKIAQMAWNIAMSANPLGAVIAAIGLLILAGGLLMEYWDPISDFFKKLWDDIGTIFATGIDFIKKLLAPFSDLFSGISGLMRDFGWGNEEEEKKGQAGIGETGGKREVNEFFLSKNIQFKETIKEIRQTSQAEVVIRDESGRGQLTEKSVIPAVKLKMIRSGE